MADNFIPQIKPREKEYKPAFQEVEPAVDKDMQSNKNYNSVESRELKMIDTDKNPVSAGKIKNPKRKVILSIVAFVVVFLVLNILAGVKIYLKARSLQGRASEVKQAVSSHDMVQLKNSLNSTNGDLIKLRGAYGLISWMKVVPFLGRYIADGGHFIEAGVSGINIAITLTTTLEPYADLVGFSGGSVSEGGEKTAADRIDFIVSAIPKVLPDIDKIISDADHISSELSVVNPDLYPVKFAGYEVRGKLKEVLSLVDEGTTVIKESKPLLEKAPSLLGVDKPRTYLVIFQNDKELRPTGGFITAYSIMNVDKAKFSPVDSSDIYNLDAKYKPTIEAPKPIIDYIKGPYVLSKNLRLRDMNWSPDFATSMKLFLDESSKVGIENVDGIIAVDTQTLVNLLNVIGPIGVPGFGNFSTEIIPECNCAQVIHELESFADVEGPIVWDPAGTGKIIYAPPNSDNRKKIIGPLMNSIMSNALGQPKEKLPALFEAAFKSLTEKHVLFYLTDESEQSAVEGFRIAGSVADYDGDYLLINDANLGGRKSNLYATQEVSQVVDIKKDGSVEKNVTITYKNPEKQDGWLNSVLPNWVRIYVPKGSELISIDGLEDRSEPYVEFDKTVYAGYFELRPQGVIKVELKYKLPFKISGQYQEMIQKQPGKDSPLYTIELGKEVQEVYLNSDKEIRISI